MIKLSKTMLEHKYIITLQVKQCTIVSDLSRCSSRPCQNGGVCLAHVASYKCKCQREYTGINCETGKNN